MFDSFERIESPTERKLLQCNQCKRAAIHSLESRCIGKWTDGHPMGDVDGGSEFSLYRCGACDEVCFEKSSWCSEDYDHDEHGQMYLSRTEVQFPPPVSSSFSFTTDHIPPKLNDILEEMLYALAGSKMMLATIALRMAIEFIVKDQQCAGKNLETKIDDLLEKQLIEKKQCEFLHKLRKKGNAGAHDAVGMNANEMTSGIQIVDGLLEKIYNGPARHNDVMAKAGKVFGNETEL